MSESQPLTMAKFAETAERYEDMVKYMKEFVEKKGTELEHSERDLLSVAYKNVVGSRRNAWRVVSAVSENMTSNKTIATDYLKTIEDELESICNEVLELLDKYLLAAADIDTQSKVFYLKMKGDYYRYLAEVASDEKLEICKKSEAAYKEAYDIADKELLATHPIKLGLALNFSVFYYEIINETQKACTLAKKTFEDAIDKLDTLKDDNYKDSTLIMQLLRDNLTLWTSSTQDNEEAEGGADDAGAGTDN